MWPADARAFSRPTSKGREKLPGDEVEQSKEGTTNHQCRYAGYGLAVESKEVHRYPGQEGQASKRCSNLKLEETALVENFKTEAKYEGVRESVMQDEKLALTVAAKTVIARALNNLNKPSVRLQPRQGNKPVHVACLEVPDGDPATN